MRANHALELHFACRKRHAATGLAEPAEEEAGQLPHTVEAEAAGHDRVALEVAGEIPVVGADIIFGTDETLVEGAAGFGNFGNAMDHEHGGQWELCISRAEQFAATAGQDLLIIVT
ncbi:hypothetical protein D3C78_1003450 [compost metagenome]